MFKKLKDKITEEVKQSPLKSVQQLASAVVSPSSSSVFEPSSNDNFCIDDDDINQGISESPQPKTVTGFTTVNLLGQASSPPVTSTNSRKSSVSSINNDFSFFPRYEPSSNHFQLQSDLESASEMEDSAISAQLERVSKENLYEAYRKLRVRYNKYKGRFVDLAEHYRRLEKENSKCKNILSETQDKALRRISELREQCSLEQEAKAHLEEALRSDLEEKDHLIATLNTKIELLKSEENKEGPQDTLSNSDVITSEKSVSQQEKVGNAEALLLFESSLVDQNFSDDLHLKEIETIKALHSEKISNLNNDLNAARKEILLLNLSIEKLKNSKDEAAYSLKQDKFVANKELEKRDEEIQILKSNIKELDKEKFDLSLKLNKLKDELEMVKNVQIEKESGDKNWLIEKEALTRKLSDSESELVNLNSELIQYKNTCADKNVEIKQLTIENDQLLNKISSFEDQLKQISKLEAELTSKSNEISTLTSYTDQFNELNLRVEALEKLKISLKTELGDKDVIIETIKDELKYYKNENISLQKDLKNKLKEIDSMKSDKDKDKLSLDIVCKQLRKESTFLKNELSKYEKSLSEKELELQEFKLTSNNDHKEKNEIYEKNIYLNNQLDELVSKYNFLVNVLTDARNVISCDDISNAKLKYKNNNSLVVSNDLQEDCQYIISEIINLKTLLTIKDKNNNELCEQLKDSHSRIKEKEYELENLSKTRSIECDSYLINFKRQMHTVKSQQKDIRLFVDKLFSEIFKQFNLIQKETDRFNEYSTKMNSYCDQKNSELDSLKITIDNLKIELNDKNSKLKEHSDVCNSLELLKNTNINYENENLILSSKMSELQTDITSLKSTCDLLKETLDIERNKCLQIEQNLQVTNERLNIEYKKCEDLKIELDSKDKAYKLDIGEKEKEISLALDKLAIKNNEFDEQFSEKEKEIEHLLVKLKNVEDVNIVSNKTHDGLSRLLEDSNETAKKLKCELNVKDDQINELEQAVHIKESKIEDLTSNLKLKQNQLESIKEEAGRLKAQSSELKESIIFKEKLINEIEEQYAKMKNENDKSNVDHKNELHVIKENFDKQLSEEIINIHNNYLLNIDALKTNLSTAEDKNIELQIDLDESALNIEKLKQDCDKIKKEEDLNKKKIDDLNLQLQNLIAAKNNSDQNQLENYDDLKIAFKENEELKLKQKNLEEEQADKIKKLVLDFNLKLSQKDEEIGSIESSIFDKKQAEEDFIALELKQQVKDLQCELQSRGDAFEDLLEDHNQEKRNNETTLMELKKSHDAEIREHDKKWRACLDRRLVETEAKYKEEIEELTKEWKSERKSGCKKVNNILEGSKELECSSQLAIAAMESSVNSVELLRKQVTYLTQELDEEKRQRKREVSELQRLLVLKKNPKKSKNQDLTVDDCTEMEYLRNILFEYMMGKEPLVLAKVLSAIVKFDSEQTNKVLQKEEQKISLLGQLKLT